MVLYDLENHSWRGYGVLKKSCVEISRKHLKSTQWNWAREGAASTANQKHYFRINYVMTACSRMIPQPHLLGICQRRKLPIESIIAIAVIPEPGCLCHNLHNQHRSSSLCLPPEMNQQPNSKIVPGISP